MTGKLKAEAITNIEEALDVVDELQDEALDLTTDLSLSDLSSAQEKLEGIEERLNQLKAFVENQIQKD